MARMRGLAAPLVIAVSLVCTSVGAQEVLQVPDAERRDGSLALGGSLRSGSSIYDLSDGFVDLLPLLLYDGRRLFANGTEWGVHAWDSGPWEIDLVARYRFERLTLTAEEVQSGLVEREQTLDAGVSLSYTSSLGELRAVLLTDTAGRHNGQEAELTYRHPWAAGPWTLSPFVSLSWQSSELANYYYGVSSGEAAADRPAYYTGSAINADVGINLTYDLSPRVVGYANFGLGLYAEEIDDSPIVADRLEATAFVGAAYRFDPARRRADGPGESPGLWSYRLFYGYGADDNIVPGLLGGFWSSSDDGNATLVNATVGRLIKSGRRADLYGRFSVNRHFDQEPTNNDVWSYAAYMMLMGKGYFPWSDRLAFRWGFGFGASYAESVPQLERLEQEVRSENTNNLQTYLEWQLDVPIDNFFESDLTRNCFVGLAALHRSGIWRTASIFGDVSGGSDYLGISIECLR